MPWEVKPPESSIDVAWSMVSCREVAVSCLQVCRSSVGCGGSGSWLGGLGAVRVGAGQSARAGLSVDESDKGEGATKDPGASMAPTAISSTSDEGAIGVVPGLDANSSSEEATNVGEGGGKAPPLRNPALTGPCDSATRSELASE